MPLSKSYRGGCRSLIVTVLFADVTGSTTLGERLDADALNEVMGTFFDAMRAEIEAEGGTVEKFIDDAIATLSRSAAVFEELGVVRELARARAHTASRD